jgi:hypothetical protein
MYHVAVRIHSLLALLLSALAPSMAGAQQATLPLWPNGAPEPYTGGPQTDITKPTDRLVEGKPLQHLTDISKPTLAFYPAPAANNTGATIVVFPGGGYRILAYDLEGTEVCTWLNSIGVNCALAQYAFPSKNAFPKTLATSKTPSRRSASSAPTPPTGTSTPTASASSASPPAVIS